MASEQDPTDPTDTSSIAGSVAASSVAASSVAVSSTSTAKSRTRTALATWEHTRPPEDGELENDGKCRILYCRYCPVKETYSSAVTTNFRRHLRVKHQIDVQAEASRVQTATLNQLQALHDQTGFNEVVDTESLRKILNQDIIDKALARLIVMRNLPFRLVEWPEFHTLCQILNPASKEFLLTAHSSVPLLITRQFKAQKDIVRKKLQSALSSIHLSLDIWTSPNRILFLGVCGHFVDQSREKLTKALLGLRPVAGHSGEEQWETLLPILQDYGIVRKLGSIVCDNASSNNTLCRTIGEYFEDEEELEWDPSFRQIRCIGHVINLAVQAFLFRNFPDKAQLESDDIQGTEGTEAVIQKRNTFRSLGPIGKLHNIVVHIRSSPGRTKEFKDLAGRLIPLDNRTRWNSWYQMLLVADKKAAAVDTYTKAHIDTLGADYLSPLDWTRLRMVMSFLQPFYRATMDTQGDSATIDRVLFSMDVLIQYFEEALVQHASDEEFSARIQSAWEVFDKYYSKTDDSPLYAAALILHPSRRTKYINTFWKREWRKPALKKVKDLWIWYRERTPLPHIITSPEGRSRQDQQDLDAYDRIIKDRKKIARPLTRPTSEDEFEDYCSGESCDIGNTSALEWWCQDQQRKRWPRLSYMAIDILSIPGMSDEPERVFSGSRRTISWDRAQLEAKTIEELECSKHWERSGICLDL